MFKPLLLAVLAAVSSTPHAFAQVPPPAVAKKLRRLLPLPEETLRQKMEMPIAISDGFGNGGQLARYHQIGSLYRHIGLLGQITGGVPP